MRDTRIDQSWPKTKIWERPYEGGGQVEIWGSS